jgi:hypothetical protein
MLGIVSSSDPLKVKDVVLAGAYDLYMAVVGGGNFY